METFTTFTTFSDSTRGMWVLAGTHTPDFRDLNEADDYYGGQIFSVPLERDTLLMELSKTMKITYDLLYETPIENLKALAGMTSVRINLSGHENRLLDDLGFYFPGSLHVDLTDPDLLEKLTKFLLDLIPVDSGQITVVLPGLAPLAGLTLTIIHGLTGVFPVTVTLIKADNGQFVPSVPKNLQYIRNSVRLQRTGSIVL